MHAISQEPHPCIYAQLESTSSDSIVDEEEPYPEIRLTPTDSTECEWLLVKIFLLLLFNC